MTVHVPRAVCLAPRNADYSAPRTPPLTTHTISTRSPPARSGNDSEVSALAHGTQEPTYITKNGEGDLVVMSIGAFENMQRQLDQRAQVLEAEARRLAGEPTYGVDEVRAMLKEKCAHARA